MNTISSVLDVFGSLPKQTQERLIAEERAPIVYSLDAVISGFLRKHDVFVTPVGSNISSSRVMSGVMGGLGGPLAVGMNQALTAQVKGAALQEWTSWKQWALSHQDFKEYKQNAETRIEKCNSRFILWCNSQEGKIIISAQQKAIKNQEQSQRKVFLCWCLAFFIGLPILLLVHEQLTKERQYPSYKSEHPSLKMMARPLL
jgi:hypothetical protein